MYLKEKSLTENRYPRLAMATVIQTNVPSAALRPLAMSLSFLKRIPRIDATIEYAVTTQAKARANWPSCPAMLITLFCDVHASRRLFFVLRGALGTDAVRHKNAIAAKLAGGHRRGTIDQCVRKGIF